MDSNQSPATAEQLNQLTDDERIEQSVRWVIALGGNQDTRVMIHSDFTEKLCELVRENRIDYSTMMEIVRLTRFGVNPEAGAVPPPRTIDMFLYKDMKES